jgi:hypothetical protein
MPEAPPSRRGRQLPVALFKSPSYLVFAKTVDKKALLKQFGDVLAKSRADGSCDEMVKHSLLK